MTSHDPGERRLNPFAFPAETNVRFALLIIAVVMLAFALRHGRSGEADRLRIDLLRLQLRLMRRLQGLARDRDSDEVGRSLTRRGDLMLRSP